MKRKTGSHYYWLSESGGQKYKGQEEDTSSQTCNNIQDSYRYQFKMKITAPDEVEIFTDVSKTATLEKEIKTFEDEIKEILRMPKVPSKFIINDDEDRDSSEFKKQVLFKFTQLCREEIIPRHVKAAETIESKMDELRCQQVYQQKEIQHLLSSREELRENMEKLEAARVLATTDDQQLNLRLKEVLEKLQDRCKNKTWAERKMAHELVDLKKRVEDIKVNLTETKSKMNYYTNQIKAQTETVKKHTKPLYLDKNKVAFMKESLNTMRGNIEELVHQVKKLKAQVEPANN